MAHSVVEITDARGVDLTTGVLTGRRTHIVDIDTSIATNGEKAVQDLMGTASTPDPLPGLGSSFPDIPQLVAVDYKITLVEGMITRWSVEHVYRVQVPIIGPGPGSVGFFEWSVSRRIEFIDAWRTDTPSLPLAAPSNGIPAPFATQADIGGEKIDSAGEPTSVKNLVQIWSVSETISLPMFGINYNDYISIITGIVGRRNNSFWYGAATGRLLYLGGSETHRSNTNIYTYTHEFAYDEFFHMRQVPQRDQNGHVLNSVQNGPPGPTGYVYTGGKVWWTQPFPRFANFDAIGLYF